MLICSLQLGGMTETIVVPRDGELDVIHIDGAMHSGSGTILRYAAALATLKGMPLHMVNIRAKRDKPGLRRQHLEALRACCSMSAGLLEGDEVSSREVHYIPGRIQRRGHFSWDIGTAGSATMLAYTVLPLAILASAPCTFSVTGGLFQDHAPTALHMQNVLFPLLKRFGAQLSLQIERPGYVPRGGGKINVRVERPAGPLSGMRLTDPGSFRVVRGISLASHLRKERVGPRMADESSDLLRKVGYHPIIQVVEDSSALQRGAALLIWAESDTGCIIGADGVGKQGRRSEQIAQKVVSDLLTDIQAGSTVDRYTADQLILFAALAEGKTEYLIPKVTDHVESNVWLVREILGCGVTISGSSLLIQGIGYRPAES